MPKQSRLFIDGIIYSLQQFGGISVLFNELIDRLPQKFVTIGVLENTHLQDIKHSIIKYKPRIGERYRSVPADRVYDLFHSTYYRIPLNKHRSTVVTVHDFVYEKYKYGIKKSIHSWQKFRAIEKADLIICVSHSTRNDLLEYGGNRYEDRSLVIHNGVSTSFRALNHIRTVEQILFVGNRSGYKNFSSVVLALRAIKDVTLVCVGGGPFNKEELLLLKSNIPDRFKNLGFISDEELNLQYNIALCLIYPSLYEGFGIPVLEAMRAGCPVIAVNSSSIPEIVENAALLINNGNPEEIQCAIRSMFNNEVRVKLIEKGIRQSLKFSWDKTFSETFSVYKSLLTHQLS